MTRNAIALALTVALGLALAAPAADKPLIFTGGIIDASNGRPGAAIAVGSIISIYGTSLSDSILSADAVPLPTKLGGAKVTFGSGSNAVDAPLFGVYKSQINAQVPWGVAPGSQPVTVTTSGGTSDAVTVTVQAVAPGVLSQASSGRGPGVVQVYDAGNYPFNDFTTRAGRKPATYGDIIVVYATGLGPVKQPPKDGDINAQPATGTITLKAVPPNGAAITVGNTTYVFRDQPSATTDVQRTPDTTASGTLTFSAAPSLPSDGATVTITAGPQTATYTFQTTPSVPPVPRAVTLTPNVAARATLTFTSTPNAGNTVRIGNQTYTFQTVPSGTGAVTLTPNVAAKATLTFNANPQDGNTVRIGTQVYTFRVLPSALLDVRLASDFTLSAQNLATVISADAASLVQAVASTSSVVLTAKTAGLAGNSVQVSVSGTFATPASQTLTGGSDGLGPTLTSLVSVITADSGSPVSATVSGTVVTLTAKTAGSAGNSIPVIVSGNFAATPVPQTLTGGSDGLGPTLTSLVSVINADSGSPVGTTVSGTVVTLTAKSAGPSGTFTVVPQNASATYQAGAAGASGIVPTLDSLRTALSGNPAVTVDSAAGASALTFHSAASGFAAISLTCTPGDAASMACSITPGRPLPSETTNTVKALVAGREVTPEWSGLVAGLVGLYQINVKIPPKPATADAAFDGCFVPLQLKITDASGSTLATGNTVTIAMAGTASSADCMAGGGSHPNISEDIAAAATLFRLRQPDGKPTKMGFRAAFQQTADANASKFRRAGFPPNGACITEVANSDIDLYSPVGNLIPQIYPLLDAGTITVATGASSTALGTIKPDANMFYSGDSLGTVTDDPASLSVTGGAAGSKVPTFGPLQMVLRTKLTALSEPSWDASTGLKVAGTCNDSTGSVVAIVTWKDSGVNGATFCSTACPNDNKFSITIKPDSLPTLPASSTANLDAVFVPAPGTNPGRVPFASPLAGEVVVLDGVSAKPFTLPLPTPTTTP
jgi:uncharacterized protein (TIGR03437 family)